MTGPGQSMQIGIVGLGRMGANIARRLMRSGHQCVVFDANLDASLALGREGATSSAALQDLVKRLAAPRTIWLMLPAGAVTETAIAELVRADGRRRHHHRRRQQLLEGRHRARRALARTRHPLSRRRHLGRRVGARARLLPDDRRRGGRGRAARSGLPRARAGGRGHCGNAAPRRPRSAARGRLSACRAQWRRTFRQDDP